MLIIKDIQRFKVGAVSFLITFAVLFGIGMLPYKAEAYTLIEEQAVQDAWKNQNLSEAEYMQGGSTAFTASTDPLTKVGFYIKNEGGSDCTGTTLIASVEACSADGYTYSSCSDAPPSKTTYTSDASSTTGIAAGATAWVEYTFSSPAPNAARVLFLKPNTPSGGTNCGSLHQAYSTSDTFNGSDWHGNAVGNDMAFRAWTGAPDPRENPVADVILPSVSTQTPSAPVQFRFGTQVCEQEYAAEVPEYFVEIQKDESGWAAYTSVTLTQSGLLVDPDNRCTPGLAYGKDWSTLISELGDYRVRVSVDFGNGYGAASSWTTFSLNYGNIVGNTGVGNWGGTTGDGSYQDWTDAVAALPSHDTVYGACDWWGSTSVDGLPCLWTWVQYIVVPPEETAFNFLQAPFNAIATRWPFVYLTNIYTSLSVGIESSSSCPLPSLFTPTDDYNGVNIATLDTCDFFDGVAAAIDDSSYASTYLPIVVWCGFAAYCIREVYSFFDL